MKARTLRVWLTWLWLYLAFSLQKLLMHLSEYFIESCCSWSQHKISVWQVLQLAQPSINPEVHVLLHHSYIT